MINWSQDAYKEALGFAASHHHGQQIPGKEWPYVVHVTKVSMEIIAALSYHPEMDGNLAVLSALLHDIIEDTAVTFEMVKENFGQAVAEGVLALTKDSTLADKPSRMRDSLERILAQPPEIGLVKLADRITNLESPPSHWSREKREKYHKEASLILEMLGASSTFLAKRLQAKIEAYQAYF